MRGLVQSSGSGEQAPDFEKGWQNRMSEVYLTGRVHGAINFQMTLFSNQANGRMAVPHTEIENISFLFSYKILQKKKKPLCKKPQTKKPAQFLNEK